MGKNIPNSDDTIKVKISGGIEMRSGRIGSLEFILRGCSSRCGNLLDIVLKVKITWGLVMSLTSNKMSCNSSQSESGGS